MTGSSHSAFLAAVGDEGLWRTNPVWCVDRLLDNWQRQARSWVEQPERLKAVFQFLLKEGIFLPAEAVERWEAEGLLHASECDSYSENPPTPGVVGLVVDDSSANAWTVILEVGPSRTWSVDSNLPFRPATVLQELLIRMILALGFPQAHAVPERFAFEIKERLGRRSYGPSMHIAGLLAVIDRQNNHPHLFRRACAVVQPDGDGLVAVGGIVQKLKAFQRECGRGTLLVRPVTCPEAAAYDGNFEEVWPVDSFQQLARRLERPGLLQSFLSGSPLNATDVETTHSCLRLLTVSNHEYGGALDLAERIQGCGFSSNVTARTRREIRRTIADLYRHLGYYEKAETLAQQEVRDANAARAKSYDEQAQTCAVHAAALFDPHRFSEIVGVLEPWLERLSRDELLVSPETRVMVFNTLARARVILGHGEWIELFHRSEVILREREPTDLPRTWNYLAHGLLRCGLLDQADSVLADIEGWQGLTGISKWICHFLRAEYHRQRGQKWDIEQMEATPSAKNRAGHPFGFYFQATARQPGRAQDNAVDRFRLARDSFLQDVGDGKHPNVLHFLADCMQLGEAAWGDDDGLWREARRALAQHLEARPGRGLAEHYDEVWKALSDHPDRAAADTFMRRIPYF